MAYVIRDDKGVLKAKVSNVVANEIINKSRGEFYKCTNGKTAFRMKEDCVYGSDRVGVYLWENDVLVPS